MTGPNRAVGRAGWDLRVVYVERRRQWWWNAWNESAAIELYGFADSKQQAWRDLDEALSKRTAPSIPFRSTRPPRHGPPEPSPSPRPPRDR